MSGATIDVEALAAASRRRQLPTTKAAATRVGVAMTSQVMVLRTVRA